MLPHINKNPPQQKTSFFPYLQLITTNCHHRSQNTKLSSIIYPKEQRKRKCSPIVENLWNNLQNSGWCTHAYTSKNQKPQCDENALAYIQHSIKSVLHLLLQSMSIYKAYTTSPHTYNTTKTIYAYTHTRFYPNQMIRQYSLWREEIKIR